MLRACAYVRIAEVSRFANVDFRKAVMDGAAEKRKAAELLAPPLFCN
ncbi:MAG TPA: hypothetical protein VIY69_14235 [Candidatus Acidoferrales bacterium]